MKLEIMTEGNLENSQSIVEIKQHIHKQPMNIRKYLDTNEK